MGKKMINNTWDTTGDVCNHARSMFIQSISKVKFEDFMKSFNEIAAKTNRGVKVHNLEVSGYQCSEPRTAKVLEMIIHETTNRINRLQQQESAAEVKLCEIKGKIDEEKAKAELLTIQS